MQRRMLFIYNEFGAFKKRISPMLSWVLIFLILSIIAGIFGFTGIAVASAEIAKIIFFVFLIMFVVTLILHLVGRSRLP